MNLLITGASGFIGKNLVQSLMNIRDGKDKSFTLDSDINIFEYDIDTPRELLEQYCEQCDFVFHLAGVNRPVRNEEFMQGNRDFTQELTELLKKSEKKVPVLMSSSTQALRDNPYGESKRAGEQAVLHYGEQTGAPVYIYRLTNVFGKWCRPNYNSVVATFCNNIANGLPITVSDRENEVKLVYIDDVLEQFISALSGNVAASGEFLSVEPTFTVKLGELADTIYSFRDSRDKIEVPNVDDEFVKKLYSTYLSYLPEDKFSYPLKMNCDARGSFTEVIRTPERGQFSVNVIKPGITKGNHWHHTKNEKFFIALGNALIRFRKVGTQEVIEYYVSGDKHEVVDIPVGYTHSIKNVGEGDLVAFMWSNECFNPDKPDTFFLEV